MSISSQKTRLYQYENVYQLAAVTSKFSLFHVEIESTVCYVHKCCGIVLNKHAKNLKMRGMLFMTSSCRCNEGVEECDCVDSVFWVKGLMVSVLKFRTLNVQYHHSRCESQHQSHQIFSSREETLNILYISGQIIINQSERDACTVLCADLRMAL